MLLVLLYTPNHRHHHLSILLSMGTQVVSSLEPLRTAAVNGLVTCVLFLQAGVELLGHGAGGGQPYRVIFRNATLLSKVLVPVYTPTSSS